MILGLLSGFKSYLIGGAAIVAVGTGAYLYYQKTQATIENLRTQREIAVAANERNIEVLKQVQEENTRFIELNNDLQSALDAATEQQNELRRILLDHDLTNLALEKPGLIEKRINDATKNVFDSLERDTAR